MQGLQDTEAKPSRHTAHMHDNDLKDESLPEFAG
jgi:hypothetical protein